MKLKSRFNERTFLSKKSFYPCIILKQFLYITALLILFSNTAHAAGGEYLFKVEFMPTVKQTRYNLTDQVNNNSVISSKLSYGFDLSFLVRILSRESMLNFGLSQHTVRLEEPINASISQEEVSYLNSHLFYEYTGNFTKFRLGFQYNRETYLNIDNNIVTPEILQNTYYVVGFYGKAKIGFKSRVYIGLDYGSLAVGSAIDGIDLTAASYFKYGTKFHFNYQWITLLMEIYYKSSNIQYNEIDQTIPELGFGLGFRF